MKLKGKVAIVTGSASGIGKAVAELYSQEGAAVIIADLPGSNGEDAAADCRSRGGQAIFIPVNISDEQSVLDMVDKTIREFGKIDILVNNAGIGMSHTNVENVSLDVYNKIMDVNMKGVFLSSNAVIPYMKKAGSGVILAIGSTGAVRPRPGLAVYNASKGAVIAFIKSIALELAPYGVRANVINPSATNTPMLTDKQRQEFIRNIPMGTIAEPIDVAHTALFLASDDARMITGADLPVDGGRCV